MKLKQGLITDIPRTLLDFFDENKHPFILTDLCDGDAELLKSMGVVVRETGRFTLQKWCYLYSSIDEHLILNKNIDDSFEFEIKDPKMPVNIKILRLIDVKDKED